MAPMPPLDRVRVVRAWAVHVFTMTGVVWACLAALALFEGQLALMWLWLGVALIVDGVDGTLARKAEVKTYAPGFDGAVLDVVDRDHPQQAAADQRRPNRAGQSFRVEDEIGGDLADLAWPERGQALRVRHPPDQDGVEGKVLDGGALEDGVRPDEERVAQDLSFGSTAGSRTGGRRSCGSGAPSSSCGRRPGSGGRSP